jgi:hypothetical protein
MTVEYSPQYLKHLESLTEEQRAYDLQEMNRALVETKKILYDERITAIREKRDELLIKSDYYFNVPDIKIDDEKKEKLLTYRQALRDFPEKIINEILYIDDKEIKIIPTPIDELLDYLPKL